jgi:biopolymer transport protein TolR
MAFGRLERTQAHQPMSDINVTPLVDVMLVLVVIFIITAPLIASTVRLDLPKTEAATPAEVAQFVSVAVDASGQIFWNEQALTPAQLAQRLQEAAKRSPETEVQLRADEKVPYGRVVEVIGLAQKAGLYRIGFVADPGKTEATPVR